MRFLKWVIMFFAGNRCYQCKYYFKPYRIYDAGFCERWVIKYRRDNDLCTYFKERTKKDG